MAKETADQKLLKLIEATDAKQTGGAAPAAPAAASAPAADQEAQKVFQSVTNVGVGGMAVPPVVRQILSLAQGLLGISGRGFGIKEFNRIFMIGVAAFVIFFTTDLVKSMDRSKTEIKLTMKQAHSPKGGAQGAVWMPTVKPFAEYEQVFSQRNIFQPFELKVVLNAEPVNQEISGIQHLTEQIKDYRLVGISWLDSPESASAMIENINSGTTYFLGEGEKIQNVTIKKIYADSIVVGIDNEEMELRL